MANFIVKNSDGDIVGYISDRGLAEHLDGLDIVVDGMYEHEQYTTERAESNR